MRPTLLSKQPIEFLYHLQQQAVIHFPLSSKMCNIVAVNKLHVQARYRIQNRGESCGSDRLSTVTYLAQSVQVTWNKIEL